MNKIRQNHLIDLTFLCAIYLWLAAYSYPYFFHSLSDNYRQLMSYNLDTGVMLAAVKDALGSRWLRMSFDDYGHFYFNLSMAVAGIYSLFAPLTERALILILRMVALLGGCFSIALVYAFAKRYLGRIEAIFAATVMAFSPAFIEYANEVKPDTWQIFFLTLALYFIARAFEGKTSAGMVPTKPDYAANLNFVLAAAAAAGAAFGTKYLGMLLLPLLGIAAGMVPPASVTDRQLSRATKAFAVWGFPLAVILIALGIFARPSRVLSFLIIADTKASLDWLIQLGRVAAFLTAALILAAAVAVRRGYDVFRYRTALKRFIIFAATGLTFLITFAISSPWLLWRLQFIRTLYDRSEIAGAGDWYGFRWLNVIFGYHGEKQSYVAYGTGFLAILGVALLVLALARRRFRGANLPFLFVLGFAAIFLTMLMTKINRMTVLYGVPIMPPLVLMAAYALYEIRGVISRHLGNRAAIAGTATLAALLMLAQIWQGSGDLMKYPALVSALTPENKGYSDWLKHCVPAKASILSTSYTYVPPEFDHVAIGESTALLADVRPDVVTLNGQDVADVAKDPEGKLAPLNADRTRYYGTIQHSSGWRAGPVFGLFLVYVKAHSGIDPACR